MKPLILDRDGVINEESDDYILSPKDWIPIEGSLEAISKAKSQGFYIIVVSNQSALGRGWMSIEDLNSINQKMQSALAKFGGKIDAFLFCPHKPADNCDCRKPKTALLDSFRLRTGINYKDCPFVGDRISDIEVAKKIGARPILVSSGKATSTPPPEVLIFDNLAIAIQEILFNQTT